MKQVLQSLNSGKLMLADIPAPGVEPNTILIKTQASLLSVGTERMIIGLAKKSLLGKARDRPDLVRKVVDRVGRDGIIPTARSVIDKLDQAIPLGYSCVGRVVAVGEGISDHAPGDLVACAGAKVANHAEVNLVQNNLTVRLPADVSAEAGAFVTVGAIALQGVRTAVPTLGETFVVLGLGLIGQITCQLLRANGCRVVGIDLDPAKVTLAQKLGCEVALQRDESVEAAVYAVTGGRGADGVLITAATTSNDPIELAGALCRDRGRVVVVGAVGMEIPRRPYYDKEIAVYQSRSYGPGRYDPVYEEQGVDYPVGYVRWTEQRNMEAFLQQIALGAVKVEPLVSHRFAIAEAEKAYQLIEEQHDVLGVVLSYPEGPVPARTIELRHSAPVSHRVRVGFLGAGGFASGVLIPAVAAVRHASLVSVASARGISAHHVGQKFHFDRCTTDDATVISASDIDAVFIATRHDLHVSQTVAALAAGKHVFVEKPVALDDRGLAEVLSAAQSSGKLLMVGFNRRFAPLTAQLKSFLGHRTRPLAIDYRINAGAIPNDSWIHDPAVGGGRIIGEVCHFIDLISFLTDATPTSVFSRNMKPGRSVRSDDNVILSLGFSDGSIATITYVATSDNSAGKERIEVLGDSSYAVLEDFRVLRLRRNGKERTITKLIQDKGHRAEVEAFVRALRLAEPSPIPLDQIALVTRASFAAVESLRQGQPVEVESAA